MKFFTLALLTLLFVSSCLQGQTYQPYDPRAVYMRPPRKEATYRSAKDYWKEKRKALSKGNRKFRSAAELANEKLVREEEEKRKAALERRKNPEPEPEPTPAGAPGAIYSVGSSSSTTKTTGSGTNSGASDGSSRAIPKATRSFTDFERSSCKRILRSLEGASYNENGSSPEEGFSPPGLVQYVFSKIGYRVPKGPPEKLWSSFGALVSRTYTSFAPGDILFFSLYSKSEQRGKLFVAIVLDEENMVYPSFTRGKVVIRTYRDRFWRKRFVGVKRVFL